MAAVKIPEVNWEHLNSLCRYDASLSVCCRELKIKHDTLERQIKKKFNMTFGQYKEEQLQYTVLKLKQVMLNKAFAGDNTALIFSLKNLGKWTDRVEHGFSQDQQSITLKYSLDKPKTVIDSSDGSK